MRKADRIPPLFRAAKATPVHRASPTVHRPAREILSARAFPIPEVNRLASQTPDRGATPSASLSPGPGATLSASLSPGPGATPSASRSPFPGAIPSVSRNPGPEALPSASPILAL